MMVLHPITKFPHRELYHLLLEEQRLGNIEITAGTGLRDDLLLFNYTRECQYKNRWNQANQLARGLVWSQKMERFMVLPFPKFFNYGERKTDLPNLRFTATHKLDGSLGIAYYYYGHWWVNTRGAFNSPICDWATDELRKNAKNLDSSTTYLFEIINPRTHIVVRYPFTGLVLLAGYCSNPFALDWGAEVERSKLEEVVTSTNLRITPSVDYDDLATLVRDAKALPRSQEGFVIRYEDGQRIKIKGDEYCDLHRRVSDVTPLAVWEKIVTKEQFDPTTLPEEVAKDYWTIYNILTKEVVHHLAALHEVHEKYEYMPDDELGKKIREVVKEHPIARFLFAFRKGTFTPDFELAGSPTRRKFFEQFKPKANLLPGYTPSSAMNLFTSDL